MYVAECTVTVRFDDDDVVDWLVGNEEITEENAETYTPTLAELQAYAWELIEQDDGEYGSISIS